MADVENLPSITDPNPPLPGSPRAVEAWFAAAGIRARVIEHCPDPRCTLCRPGTARAA